MSANDTPQDNSKVESCGGADGSRGCFCYRPVNAAGGLCVRNPPQVVVLMVPAPPSLDPKAPRSTPQANGQWPPVPATGWCYGWVAPEGESDEDDYEVKN